MGAYHIYFINTFKTKPGKGAAAIKWWQGGGRAVYETLPGVKSVRMYAAQFGLGGDGLEMWTEIEDYGAMDKWDEAIVANPDKFGAFFKEFNDLFEPGPSRIMGDWPESNLAPGE